MTIEKNLDGSKFTPEYGCDDNGIQYSCGHINPLQTTLTLINEKFDNIIDEIKYIKNECLDFSKNRCEEIREINSCLRRSYDHCQDEMYSLECEKEELEDKVKKLEDELEEVKDKMHDMQSLLDSIE